MKRKQETAKMLTKRNRRERERGAERERSRETKEMNRHGRKQPTEVKWKKFDKMLPWGLAIITIIS